jgi:hypothetical protein
MDYNQLLVRDLLNVWSCFYGQLVAHSLLGKLRIDLRDRQGP